MSEISARCGRREKKKPPPPTNGSTWRILPTARGSSGESCAISLVLPPAHFRKGEVKRGEGLSSGGLPVRANARLDREILPIAAPWTALLAGVSVVIHATLSYTGSTPKFPAQDSRSGGGDAGQLLL